MAQEYTGARMRSRLRIDPPRKYYVVFHNDDFTTMDFVVDILEMIFSKTEAEAEKIMLDVHKKGKGIVGSYTLDIARTLRDRATALAREEGFPLTITIEEA